MTIANIVLVDATSPTPVSHTFVPIADGAISQWINSTGALSVSGQESLKVEITRGKTDTADSTARVVLVDPQEATVDGVAKKVSEVSISINVRATPGTSPDMVNNAMEMLESLMGDTAFRDSIKYFRPQINADAAGH